MIAVLAVLLPCSLRSLHSPCSLWWQGAPNCLLTPHVAIQGDPAKTGQGHIDVVLENVGLAMAGKPLKNVVDKRNWF